MIDKESYNKPPADKTRLVDWIRTEHDLLEGTIARLDAPLVLEPALEGGWSVKDVMAHITGWEQLLVTWLRAKAQGGVPQVPELSMESEEIDQFNEQLYLQNKERPLHEIRRDFNRSYEEVLREVEALPETGLYEQTSEGTPAWKLVAYNTYLHYLEHREAIESWLEERASDGRS